MFSNPDFYVTTSYFLLEFDRYMLADKLVNGIEAVYWEIGQ